MSAQDASAILGNRNPNWTRLFLSICYVATTTIPTYISLVINNNSALVKMEHYEFPFDARTIGFNMDSTIEFYGASYPDGTLVYVHNYFIHVQSITSRAEVAQRLLTRIADRSQIRSMQVRYLLQAT